jgi:hypothetical protein
MAFPSRFAGLDQSSIEEDTHMVVPTIDDLKIHGLLTADLLDAFGDLCTSKCRFELAMNGLPKWYRDRLRALAALTPVEARDIYLGDVAALMRDMPARVVRHPVTK